MHLMHKYTFYIAGVPGCQEKTLGRPRLMRLELAGDPLTCLQAVGGCTLWAPVALRRAKTRPAQLTKTPAAGPPFTLGGEKAGVLWVVVSPSPRRPGWGGRHGRDLRWHFTA